jgi:hypothetical protein
VCPPPPDPPDAAAFAQWVGEFALAQAEARALVLLADAGFPTDLTRAPTAAEVASATAFAAIETDVDSSTAELVAALVAARLLLLGATGAVLAGAVSVAEVLRRLDLTVAGILTVPGAFDVVTDLQRTLRGLLAGVARRSIVRVITDAARARITPTAATTVEQLVASPALAEALEVQSSRLAAETATSTTRTLREVAQRTAAASAVGSASPDPRNGSGSPAGPGSPAAAVTRLFVDLVTADARDAGVPRALADSAHQAALGAHGSGRTVAQGVYERPSVRERQREQAQQPQQAERDSSREEFPAAVTPPTDVGRGAADVTPTDTPAGQDDPTRPGGPLDPQRDSRRSPVAEFTPEPGAWFYASELLDRNTCTPCAAVDGREYDSWTDALVDYPTGQYRLCEGGTRCRGTVVMVSARENRATLRSSEA